MGGDDVFVAFLNDSGFAFDDEFHFSFYHCSPLRIGMTVLGHLRGGFHFEKDHLLPLALQDPRSDPLELNARFRKTCYDLGITSLTLNLSLVHTFHPNTVSTSVRTNIFFVGTYLRCRPLVCRQQGSKRPFSSFFYSVRARRKDKKRKWRHYMFLLFSTLRARTAKPPFSTMLHYSPETPWTV